MDFVIAIEYILKDWEERVRCLHKKEISQENILVCTKGDSPNCNYKDSILSFTQIMYLIAKTKTQGRRERYYHTKRLKKDRNPLPSTQATLSSTWFLNNNPLCYRRVYSGSQIWGYCARPSSRCAGCVQDGGPLQWPSSL